MRKRPGIRLATVVAVALPSAAVAGDIAVTGAVSRATPAGAGSRTVDSAVKPIGEVPPPGGG